MLEGLKLNAHGNAEITDLYAWMDGGTVTVQLTTVNETSVEIEFVQKVFLDISERNPHPGRLLLNKQVVDLRSELETQILTILKQADFGVHSKSARDFKDCLEEAIDFIESDAYVRLVKDKEA